MHKHLTTEIVSRTSSNDASLWLLPYKSTGGLLARVIEDKLKGLCARSSADVTW